MNDAELALPEWMTEIFQKQCITSLTNWRSDEFQIEKVKLQYAVPLGTNYTSTIYKLYIDASLKGRHLTAEQIQKTERFAFIVKKKLEFEDISKMEEESQSYAREIDMYEHLLPELQKTLISGGIHEKINGSCVYTSQAEAIIVMENLNDCNYEMLGKNVSLDLKHCKKVLKRLSMLHGSSMHYYACFQPPVKDFYYMAYVSNSETVREMMEKYSYDELYTIRELLQPFQKYESVLNVIDKMVPGAHSWFYNTFKYEPGNVFNAQIHGDAWITNMMFKYDQNGTLDDVLLIDFQLSNYGSIANDFLFFFFSSADEYTIVHHFNTLVEYYHSQLSSTLVKIGYKNYIPKLNEFRNELKRANGVALFILFFMLKVMKVEHNDANKDVSGYSMEENINRTRNSFADPKLKKILFFSLDAMIDAGLFDIE